MQDDQRKTLLNHLITKDTKTNQGIGHDHQLGDLERTERYDELTG